MPKEFTTENVARAIWEVIQESELYKNAKSLTSHLGPEGKQIIDPYFPTSWLSGIKVNDSKSLRFFPLLSPLFKKLDYTIPQKLTAPVEAKKDPDLWKVLMDFVNLDPNGITYGNVILLTTDKKDDLAVIFHELVHTLQFKALGPKLFLQSYLDAFRTMKYRENPAEAEAYRREGTFRNQIETALDKKLTEFTLDEIKKALDENLTRKSEKKIPSSVDGLVSLIKVPSPLAKQLVTPPDWIKAKKVKEVK